MYYPRVWDESCQNCNFIISQGGHDLRRPPKDLNDLEKIQPYDFQLDGPLKMPNPQ